MKSCLDVIMSVCRDVVSVARRGLILPDLCRLESRVGRSVRTSESLCVFLEVVTVM